MECLIQVLLLVTTFISNCTAIHQVFYVLPDNSTNASCSFQPCATLSQYFMDNNGSLPVLSNVEYHFLPGEHHIPTEITLWYLQNFTIIGSQSSTTVFTAHAQSNIKVFDSVNVSIINVVFKKHDMDKLLNEFLFDLYNLVFTNCFSCKLMKLQFLEYGFQGENLIGNSYLNDILIVLINHAYNGIELRYTGDFPAEYQGKCLLVMNEIYMSCKDKRYQHTYVGNIRYGTGISIELPIEFPNIFTVVIINSYFYDMDQKILGILSGTCATESIVKIKNCTFQDNSYYDIFEPQAAMIKAELSHFNVTLIFTDCKFLNNYRLIILSIEVYRVDVSCWDQEETSCAFSSRTVITNCSYFNNNWRLLKFFSSGTLACASVYITGPVYIFENDISGGYIFYSYDDGSTLDVMHIENLIVHINGQIYISNNYADSLISCYSSDILFNGLIVISNNAVRNTVMQFQSSCVIFNGPIIISENVGSITLTQSCNVTFNGPITISMNTKCEYIMLLQYSNILFSKQILFESNSCHQIVVLKSPQKFAYIRVMEYSNITFTQNNSSNIIVVNIDNNNYNFYPFCLFQYVALQNVSAILPSHYTIIISDSSVNKCELSFLHYIYHCKWIHTAVFRNYKTRDVNQQIVELHQKQHHTTIFYCSNFNVDKLGPVHPGQILQVEFCMPCSDNYSVLYAETHNTFLPKSACNIADQTKVANVITNNYKMVSYTIVSEDNDSCELFLTVSPYLYYIYEVFDVQLLPCPIGFTLQNGVCDCDPLLPTDIDTCYIDQSAIKRPDNTWISYTQSGTSKYLISDCPIDYCLPFSSNVNLLHPDTQCQFNRTGILCSQCQYSLSMVFGSSRCMKCTNVHILITIIVIATGIVLVVLLYLLNLTVTKATISGIILYANVVSINNSVFLINDRTFKPLQVFISFVNLDLGIEVCFYNGMTSYVKMWLQLFFPVFLMIIAFSIIIASRYSSRILRLTYKRSLPVLATLFLLSYTSVLRTVLTVLFSYSTITHAPSGRQELLWSVDTSVALFGLKFTVLFITCVVLFSILLFFNIILLFTRCLAQFKLINHFKPILDAFQGPYKDRYYYWVAVHIILRSLLFALYAFQTKVRLVLATVILVPFTSIFGYVCPNKNKLINFQELLLLINLTIMHAVSYYSGNGNFDIVVNLMISLAFIQLCIIIIYHFVTYTFHCDIENTLENFRKKLVNYFKKEYHTNDISLLNIPDRTYNYSEYQDGLVSDDFAVN